MIKTSTKRTSFDDWNTGRGPVICPQTHQALNCTRIEERERVRVCVLHRLQFSQRPLSRRVVAFARSPWSFLLCQPHAC